MAGIKQETSREFDFSTVNVAVKADETLIADSLFNSVAKRNIPYCIAIPWRHKWKSPCWGVVLNILMFPVAFAGLYGFFCLIKMVMAVTRREVFIRDNVFRMRVFIYTIILMVNTSSN